MATLSALLNTRRPRMTVLVFLLCLAQAALAADWKLKDKDGISHTLAGLQGKWVLVNFWAPWCPPCLEEMPGFNALQKRHTDLQVIGVAVMYGKKKEVLDVVRAQALAYPIVMGSESIASEFGEISGLPTSFLYSPTGQLVGRHEGPLSARDIEQAMARSPQAAGLFSGGD